MQYSFYDISDSVEAAADSAVIPIIESSSLCTFNADFI